MKKLIYFAVLAVFVYVIVFYAGPIVGDLISGNGGISIDLSSIPFIGEKLGGPAPKPTETGPPSAGETPSPGEAVVIPVDQTPPPLLTPQLTPVPTVLPTRESKSLVQRVDEGSEGYTQIKRGVEQAIGFDLLDWVVKGFFIAIAAILAYKIIVPRIVKWTMGLLEEIISEVGSFVGKKLRSPQILGFLITILGLGVLAPSALKAPNFVGLTSVSILWPLMLGMVGYILLSKWDLIDKIMDIFGGFLKITGLLIWLVIGILPRLGLSPSTFLSGKAAVVANSVETANQAAVGVVSSQAAEVSSSSIAISLLIIVLGAFLINEGSDGGGLFRGRYSGSSSGSIQEGD